MEIDKPEYSTIKNVTTNEIIPIGGRIIIKDGMQLTFLNSLNGRLAVIQMVNGYAV